MVYLAKKTGQDSADSISTGKNYDAVIFISNILRGNFHREFRLVKYQAPRFYSDEINLRPQDLIRVKFIEPRIQGAKNFQG